MEILLLLINLTLLLGLFVYTFLTYKNLPGRIPVHFGITGKPTSYGPKLFFWVLPILAIVIMYISCFSFSNLLDVTAKDFTTIHTFDKLIGQNIPVLLNAVILFLFIDLQNSIHRVARGKTEKMNKSVWFWFILIIVLAFLI